MIRCRFRCLSIHAPNLHNQNRSRLSFDFFPGQPNAGLFPLKTWRRLLQQSLSQGGAAGLAHYGDPSGLTALRSAISGHLAATRSVVVDPNDVVIVSGIQEGINIAASLFWARARSGWSKRRVTRAPPMRFRPLARGSWACRSTRKACRPTNA